MMLAMQEKPPEESAFSFEAGTTGSQEPGQGRITGPSDRKGEGELEQAGDPEIAPAPEVSQRQAREREAPTFEIPEPETSGSLSSVRYAPDASKEAESSSSAGTERGGLKATAVVCLCGYNLTGAVIGGTCPECGRVVTLFPAGHPLSAHAIAALVLGILSLMLNSFGCMCGGSVLGLPCGVLGLVFGAMARRQIQRGEPLDPGSGGLALAGLVCSGVGLALGVLGGAWVGWIFWVG